MDVDYHLVIGQCLYIILLAFVFVIIPVPAIVVVGSLVVLSVCTILCISSYQYIQRAYAFIIRGTRLPIDVVKLLTVPTFFTAVIIMLLTTFKDYFLMLYMIFICIALFVKQENNYFPDKNKIPVNILRQQSGLLSNSNSPKVAERRRSPEVAPVRARSSDDWVRRLVEALKCCVCYATLAPDVVMCVRGHAICRVCKDRGVSCCPLCYHRFMPMVCNTLLKQIIDSVPQRYHEL